MSSARLSASEVKFERDGIALGVRRDGRGLLDSRHVNLQVNLLPQANGSSRVRTMLAETDLLCGVKLEVGQFADQAVQCSVDLGAIARTDLFGQVEAQKRAERRGLELADQILTWLSSSVSLPPALIPNKVRWVLFVDVVVLADGGNLLDLISLAVYAALCNARVPVAVNKQDDDDNDGEGADDFDINPDILSAERLSVDQLTLAVTCWVISGQVVCDPTPEEEACADCGLVITINRLGEVASVYKLGAGRVHGNTRRLPTRS
ncbi:hypothetical protein BASA81_002368 [Batrachochytrium salamandrivorans]|nr:hypothetical protein BASA81_002368 [Batrachochytrium salamandrivorans]